MRKFVGMMLLVAGCAPALVGCSQHASTVRGQSPCQNGHCPPGAMAGHPGMGHPGMGYHGMGHPGMGHPGMGHPGMGHPGGMYDGWNCRRPCDNGCPEPERVQGANYRYVEPSCLQYPTQPDVPAVVQYPYYTLKGPDCFFHDSDG